MTTTTDRLKHATKVKRRQEMSDGTSFDDDKLDMRSKQCENDMLVQQRHDASGE